jgi:hypothetical protein
MVSEEEKRMLTKRLHSISILAGLALLAAGCGSNARTLPPYYNTMGGFGVTASDPIIRQTMVPQNIMIRVAFNEPVDPASVAGSFKFTETVGTTATDKTANLTVAMSNGNAEIDFTPVQMLAYNGNYRLTISTTLRSVSGKNMVQVFDLLFSTGDGYGIGTGVNTKPGQAPYVVSLEQDILGTCLDFIITYSEDLIYAPRVRVEETFLGISWLSSGSAEISAQQLYNDRRDIYWVRIGQCECELLDISARYQVTVWDAIDFDQERQTQTKSESFGIPIFASCSGY